MLLSFCLVSYALFALSRLSRGAPRLHEETLYQRQQNDSLVPMVVTSYVYAASDNTTASAMTTRSAVATSYVYATYNTTAGTSNASTVVTTYVYATPTTSNAFVVSPGTTSPSGSNSSSTVNSADPSHGMPSNQLVPSSTVSPGANSPTTSLSSSIPESPLQTAQSPLPDSSVVQAQSSSPRPLMMTYYVEWASAQFPPEKVDFGRFDWIDFAFGVPNSTFDITWDGPDHAADMLGRLVDAAHAVGTKIKLSIGGWTGSKHLSTAVSTSRNRKTFASKILNVYQQFNLDGIDIDWEYPGQSGYPGNHVSRNDTSNLLLFLRLLRTTLPASAKLSATGQTVPFANSNGDPLADASPFAAVLDWVLIMNYDTWGASKPPGPNAPLSNACKNSTMPDSSAFAALAAWTGAGFPAAQLVLGVPSYGYISQSTAGSLRTRSLPPSWRSNATTARSLRYDPVLDVDDPYMVAIAPDAEPASETSRFELKATPDAVPDGSGDENSEGQADGGQSDDDGGDGDDSGDDSAGDDDADQDQDEDDPTAKPPAVESAPQHSAPMASADDSGQIQFRDLVTQGVLQYRPVGLKASPPTGIIVGSTEVKNTYEGWSGFSRLWDNCSNTPFLRSPGAGQVIPYDDAVSLALKAAFVRKGGMLGVNMFDVHGDTDQWDLTDALRQGLGLI